VVFLDIKMPKLDGFEVLRWIRKQGDLATLPVVMLSGSDEPRDLRRAVELGATRYVIKHPPPEVIAELMADYSRKR
jgi:CheY-like chemotaxis protein